MGGYNTRVEHRGKTFIVQTQDKGAGAQDIESLIYGSGRLLTSKRSLYTAFAAEPDFRDRIERMMEEPHKAILGEIVKGRHV
jgi:hypothetical protein